MVICEFIMHIKAVVAALRNTYNLNWPTTVNPEPHFQIYFIMVGLSASGKSTWAERWVNEHPEK